ncbi:MAG TPA: CDP-glycerol glycerophosphotransferase family protein [Vicinamibacterales bacterium]|nr:CDP-glycerol glycerophosphotransferase family protein [Vicinamibacterales bacterium]
MTRFIGTALGRMREVDTRISRRSGGRRILVDARTPVNFTMVSPVVRAMEQDPRVQFYFTASEAPERLADIYWEAPDVRTIDPRRAALMKFDAYVASDFMWASLPRGTHRVQVFHGVGGKYGFDVPDASMRDWHRFFFVNQRRLRNFIQAGAIEPDSPAIRMIGMPKVDCLVDGTFDRDAVLLSLGLDPVRPTVLYAPTWSPASSLNAMGVELVNGLRRMPINLIVKLHDNSRDLRTFYSGGVDWVARLEPLMTPGQSLIAPAHDISRYLVAADLMITDHSSAGFEFLLRDRPIVRIHRPALIELANIHPDYVNLLAAVSDSIEVADDALAAVARGLDNPGARSPERRAAAADLFHDPGGATGRSITALYELIELDPAPVARIRQGAECQPSA